MTAFCSTPDGTPATVAVALDHAGSRERLCARHCKKNVPPAPVECAQAAPFFIADRLPKVMLDNVGVVRRAARAAKRQTDAACP